MNDAAGKLNKPAEPSTTADELIERERRFDEAGRDRELYETIYGAPGEFPANE